MNDHFCFWCIVVYVNGWKLFQEDNIDQFAVARIISGHLKNLLNRYLQNYNRKVADSRYCNHSTYPGKLAWYPLFMPCSIASLYRKVLFLLFLMLLCSFLLHRLRPSILHYFYILTRVLYLLLLMTVWLEPVSMLLCFMKL